MSSKGFFDYDPATELTFIPFDIETTGFKASEGDFITTVVLFHEETYHIWLNTDGDTDVGLDQMYDKIERRSGLDNFVVYVCETEKLLLENIKEYLDNTTDQTAVLTAFNGETFRGDTDFDVPFMRTRCLRNGVPWILSGHWYMDSFEVFSQKNRFDTTVKDEPSLESMKKDDVKQFVKDMDFDIHFGRMKKAEIVRAINQHSGVTGEALASWAEENDVAGVDDPTDPSNFNRSELEDFIDDKSLGISYGRLKTDELIKKVREQNYTEDLLVEWHDETGRSIGTTEIGDLDGIHEVMVEDLMDDEEWGASLPFEVEVFEPFDPYVSSGEAVTGYINGDYAGVILHCFADVARTVNLTRMLVEYVAQSDYQPKVL